MGRTARILIEAPKEVLIGHAQVMLQPSHLVGAAFIIGTFWNSWIIASLGVLGCIGGVLAAHVLNFPEEERREGLYGFNGTLVGLGCSYFYAPSVVLGILIFVGGITSTAVMYCMLRRSFNPFTFPFVFVTWVIFAVIHFTGWADGNVGSSVELSVIVIEDALSRGIGQVLFQENLITGAVLLAAIAIRDWVQGLYTVLATVCGLLAGYAAGFPIDAVNLGLFGYSGVLCAILFAGCTLRNFLSALAAISLSIVIVRLFHLAEAPAFTFPFVLASWIVLWIRGKRFT